MARKFEGSRKDNMMDAKAAKRMGMSRSKFEGSAADKKMDAAGQRRMNKKKK